MSKRNGLDLDSDSDCEIELPISCERCECECHCEEEFEVPVIESVLKTGDKTISFGLEKVDNTFSFGFDIETNRKSKIVKMLIHLYKHNVMPKETYIHFIETLFE